MLFDLETQPNSSDYINFGYNQALKDVRQFTEKSNKL